MESFIFLTIVSDNASFIKDSVAAVLEDLIRIFIEKNGGMMTFTVASKQYQEIYEIAKASNQIQNPMAAAEKLMPYADIMVRVGGWNAPFITLPLSHMENYINRPVRD